MRILGHRTLVLTVAAVLAAPGELAAQTLASLTPNPLVIPAGGHRQLRVTLDQPVPFDTQVALSIVPTHMGTVPAIVTIGGSGQAVFSVAAGQLEGHGQVSASLFGSVVTAEIVVGSATAAVPALGTAGKLALLGLLGLCGAAGVARVFSASRPARPRS